MKRFLVGCLVFVLFVGLAIPGGFVSYPTARAQTGQTYTVLVGAEQLSLKASIMGYFPKHLQIHAGDKVTWQINSMEFHTVTFLKPGDTTIPPFVVPAPSGEASPLMVNPDAVKQVPTDGSSYNGTTYANSGIMGEDPHQIPSYSLIFTNEGTYNYVCIMHGKVMSGTIEVVADTTNILTPQQVNAQAHQEIAAEKAKVPHLVQLARSEIVKPADNGDGTVTFTVKIGGSFNNGEIDLMGFYPDHWVVRPGDKVTYEFSSTDLAPHTVTFLNGTADIPVVIPGSDPTILLLNPKLLTPTLDKTITDQGLFNSGFMDPTNLSTPQSYSITIGAVNPGNLDYECLLHDTMGMTGTLTVVTDTTSTSDLLAMNALPTWFTSPGYILFMPTVASAAQQ